MAKQKNQRILPWNSVKLEELLRDLIAHRTETTKVDFKAELELTSPEQKAELLKDISAIANSYDESNGDHGFLIYGVKAQKIAGVSATQTDPDNLQNTIEQLLRDNINPMTQIFVMGFEEPTGEKWGVVVIPPRHDKPYMFFKDFQCQNPAKSRRKGEWFVRKGATTSPGLPEDLSRITRKQSELELIPLREGMRALQVRVAQLEAQYDSALFNLVSKLASKLDDTKATPVEPVSESNGSGGSTSAKAKFPAANSKDGPARFRPPNEALGFEDDAFGRNEKEIFLSEGPAMWLRLMPTTNPQREWPTRELKRVALERSLLLPLLRPAGGYSYLRASDGEGMYYGSGKPAAKANALEISSVAFAFKTGEVWSIDTALFSLATDKLFAIEIEKAFAQGISSYSEFLLQLGLEFPFHWKAGVTGVKGRRLQYPAPAGHQWVDEAGRTCLSDLIEAEGQIEDGQNATTALQTFFEKIFDECGQKRPDYMPLYRVS